MDINTFFINAIRDKAHWHRAWVIRTFGIAMDDSTNVPNKPWNVVRSSVGLQVYNREGTLENLDDAVLGAPVMQANTVVYAPAGFFEHWPDGGFTTAGNLFYNATSLWPVVGSKFGYENGNVNQKKIEDKFSLMVDDPEDGIKEASKVYVSDWLRYGQSIKYLEEAAPLFVSTLSRQSIVPNKKVLERKAQLLEEHKDELNDPIVQARIYKELEDLDNKDLANDPGYAFISSGKSRIARRKLTVMYGSEQGLDVSQRPMMITQSLHDGLRPEHLVDVMNVSRAGSFDRGSETMLGGVEAKWGDRGTAGVSIAQEDCLTTLNYTYVVGASDIANTVNRWRVMPDNSLRLIERNEDAMALIGQTISVRAPNRCKAGPSLVYCKYCLGANLSANPNAVGLAVSAYGSGFLQLFLQSMHAKATVMVRMNIRKLMS